MKPYIIYADIKLVNRGFIPMPKVSTYIFEIPYLLMQSSQLGLPPLREISKHFYQYVSSLSPLCFSYSEVENFALVFFLIFKFFTLLFKGAFSMNKVKLEQSWKASLPEDSRSSSEKVFSNGFQPDIIKLYYRLLWKRWHPFLHNMDQK